MTRKNDSYEAKETFYKISWDFNEVQPAYEKWLKSKGKPQSSGFVITKVKNLRIKKILKIGKKVYDTMIRIN